ncbi:MAG: hypothetical protein ACM4D3_23200 [Candidatus Sericytochromatia bacterium]
MTMPDVDILAHHSLLLAIPAFVPAIAVVGVIIWVAMRDRRTPDDTAERDNNSE